MENFLWCRFSGHGKKLAHVVCQHMSQIDVTKTLRPIEAVILFLPMILNTDLCKKCDCKDLDFEKGWS